MATTTPENGPTDTAPSSTDAGGVAARHGFRFQDHVAATCFIEMLSSKQCMRIECETADDILVVWRKDPDVIHEYIQVKTTDANSKWALTELTDRSNPKTESSIAEASLNCDKHKAFPKFKIITRRDVNKTLEPLKIPLSQRTSESGVQKLAESIHRRRKTSRSPNGRDLIFWAQNTFWEVAGEKSSLEAKNINLLSEVCSNFGAIPDHAQLKELYRGILTWVDDAAEASRKTDPNKKTIFRQDATDWFDIKIREILSSKSKLAKPYRSATPKFFTEFGIFSEDEIKRAMSAYDAEFEFKKWRSLQLAEHLVKWLPEICLKASEIVNVDQFNLEQKFQAAIKRINSHVALDIQTILAETLLHAVLRHFFDSEPIACKLFTGSTHGIRNFGNAHIVKRPHEDELWLGRSSIVAADSIEEISTKIRDDIRALLEPELLREEKNILIALREPQHLLPTDLDVALDLGASFDHLLKRICVPILVGYDSAVLNKGYFDKYREELEIEVQGSYETLKAALPTEVDDLQVRIQIIILPMECVDTLLQQFENILKKT